MPGGRQGSTLTANHPTAMVVGQPKSGKRLAGLEIVTTHLTYYYAHHDEMAVGMNDAAATAESLRPAATVSREGLLRRQKGAS
jgi:hypothetical protein